MKKKLHIVPFIGSLLVAGSLAGQNDITLNLTLDQYGNETEWELIDLSDMTVIEGGGVYDLEANIGEYPLLPLSIPGLADGDYRFAIYDSEDDGICCAYGNGMYEVIEDATLNVIASGGAFGTEDVTDFTLPLPPPPVGVPTELSINIEEWSQGPNGNGFSRPSDIQNAGDDRLFVLEQTGKIWIVDALGQVNATPFLDITGIVNAASNEQGLLGLAFHPDYDQNGYFYLNYTSPGGSEPGGTTHISRFTVTGDPDVADPASEDTLFTVSQHSTNHNGGQLAFGPDGYLYIGLGDGGGANDTGNRAQNLQNALGKMLRLDVDGGSPYAIPADNPYINDSSILDEIWGIGLRNPWRFSFDSQAGDMWIADVGQNLLEEVDFQPASSVGGENYGWRCYEANDEFNTTGCGAPGDYVYPITDHSHNDGWCSITGGYVYRGSTFPLLDGHYIYVDYCAGEFYTLVDENGAFVRRNVLNSGQFGFTTFGVDIAGEMYVANANNGSIYKIEEPCSASIPTASYDGAILSSSTAVAYYWYLDGVLVPGAEDQTHEPAANGFYYVVTDDGNGCLVASNEVEVTAVGIEELLMQGLKLIPNPAMDRVTITADRLNGALELSLMDISGRIVMQEDLGNTYGPFQKEINVSQLQRGLYLLSIRVNGNEHVEKLMLN